jgi:hypothetical protein
VCKRSRSGHTRRLELRVKRDRLCWRTKLNRHKYFDLVDVAMDSSSSVEQDLDDSILNVGHDGPVYPSPVTSEDALSSQCQWVKLRNNARTLDLWFPSQYTATIFREWLRVDFIDYRARQTTMLAHQEEAGLE